MNFPMFWSLRQGGSLLLKGVRLEKIYFLDSDTFFPVFQQYNLALFKANFPKIDVLFSIVKLQYLAIQLSIS